MAVNSQKKEEKLNWK